MNENIITLEGHVPTLKEILRSIMVNIPGTALALSLLFIATLYVVWSSLKAGVHYSKGSTIKQSISLGFYKSAFCSSPTCISRTLYVCALVLAFLLCAMRGILGLVYVELP